MKYKVYKVIALISILLFNISTVFAQEVPCFGDPDDADFDPNTCPIDSWIVILVLIAAVFTFIHLNRQRKAATTTITNFNQR